jgi:hypothetical protein
MPLSNSTTNTSSYCTHSLLHTHTTGLFHKGEQAVEDGKAAADSTLSAAERKAKAAADEAARTAQDGKEQAKGVFGGESHTVHTSILCIQRSRQSPF